MHCILTICNEICMYTGICLRVYFAIIYRCQYLFHVFICLRILTSQILENINYFNKGRNTQYGWITVSFAAFNYYVFRCAQNNVFLLLLRNIFFVHVSIHNFKTNIYEFISNNMCLVQYWETSNVNLVVQIKMLCNLSVGLVWSNLHQFKYAIIYVNF